jgi:uncharacterized membrane protein
VSTGRLEAFSDGVFAVAITLLVLDLRVAGPGKGSLVHQLGGQWPAFAAYLISFLVIGIIWVNHHTLMRSLVAVDRTLLFLNLGLLMFVTVIPFPTSLVAQYLRAGGWDAKVATALYGAVMEGMSLAFAGVFVWAGRHEELLGVDAERHRSAFRQFGIGSLVYLGTIAVAFLSPAGALAAHFLIAAFYVVDRTASAERPRPDRAPTEEGG